MERKLEKRTLKIKDENFRAEEIEGIKKIRGYPIVFDVPGTPYRGCDWTEVIDHVALDDVDLSELRFLVNHDTGKLLARAGINLKAEKDNTGLFIETSLPDTSLARDTWELVKAGIMDGMSFSFWADVWETDTEKQQDRIMHITDIPEVSLVTFPAYQATVAIATEQRGENIVPDTQEQGKDEEAKKRAEAELALQISLI